MFAQARKAGLDMDLLGDQMRARKAQLTETFAREGLPAPETRSFTGHDLEDGAPVTEENASPRDPVGAERSPRT
jgi:hypothetical protein